jgi:hypothetical protein
MHYSGVWDSKAATEHPDWAMVIASGEKSTQKMSFFSPYSDQLLIPQLKELSSEYHFDGLWMGCRSAGWQQKYIHWLEFPLLIIYFASVCKTDLRSTL